MTPVRLKIDEVLTADPDPTGRRHKTNESRSDDFPAGSLGCKGGGGEPPLPVHGYKDIREATHMR